MAREDIEVDITTAPVDADKWLCALPNGKGFANFIRLAWHVVEPAHAFVPGFHIDAIAEHLEAVRTNAIGNLIINVPPGHAKSTIVGVLWPAFCWTLQPELRFICGSYALNLATRDSIRMRELVGSDWYQERWGDKVIIKGGKDTQAEYETSMRGMRYATSVGGSVTGRHAHIQLLDDPLGALQAHSEAERNAANLWIDSALSTRWLPGVPSHRVVIMQRLHEDDPTGHLLRQGGYEHLCLPAEYEPRTHVSAIAGLTADVRTVPGELLWPQLYPRAKIEELKRQLGSYGAAGQLQQRPAPADGGIFKKNSLRYYRYAELPAKFNYIEFSVDCNFGETVSSDPDYVAIGVFGVCGANSYLLRMVRERFDYPQTKATLRQLRKSYPGVSVCRVERKANGAALISELKGEWPGLVGYEPKESKLARAHTIIPQVEAGQFFLPHPDDDPMTGTIEHELMSFPHGSHDDMVDSIVMHLISKVDSDLAYFMNMAQLR